MFEKHIKVIELTVDQASHHVHTVLIKSVAKIAAWYYTGEIVHVVLTKVNPVSTERSPTYNHAVVMIGAEFIDCARKNFSIATAAYGNII